jgi:hypothetical protein
MMLKLHPERRRQERQHRVKGTISALNLWRRYHDRNFRQKTVTLAKKISWVRRRDVADLTSRQYLHYLAIMRCL